VKTTAKKGVQIVVEHCVAAGMKYVVFSPGSRNAPLVIAFNQHPSIECIVIPDERCAAFYALGMAQQLQAPVGIACTSGSAALNYYPAIAEAYYQQVPLLVFTADRPQAWVNQGDGQTIVQEDVYKNHILFATTIPEENGSSDYEWFVNREISTAIQTATGKVKGPVHLNFPFTEPLYQQVEVEPIQIQPIDVVETEDVLTPASLKAITSKWNSYTKKMVLVGQMTPNLHLENCLAKMAEDQSVVFLVENTANQVNTRFVQCIDRTLEGISAEKLVDFSPELLIVVGGAVVSKKIKAFLRKTQPKETWRIGYDFPFMDTYQSMNQTFQMSPAVFFSQLNDVIEKSSVSPFWKTWKQLDYINQDKATEFIQSAPYSDLKVFHLLNDIVPENAHLHLANSSVIRYSQLFNPVKGIVTWSNRGTSGIDGSTSTFLGSALITNQTWHTLITGDVSFFYDSNAFWNKLKLPNARIFLINNGGGGIFKIIPGPDSTEELDDFFVFNHGFSAEHICKAYGVDYLSANSIEEIEQQWEGFYQYDENGRPALMEIFTPREVNDKVLKSYFNHLTPKS
jgi:2-succinyl-5-enolpyruvyl-6-hydroxy-3-cyclohexene-1-carboxylate synthase